MLSAEDFLSGQRGWNALTLKAQKASFAIAEELFYRPGRRVAVPTLTPGA